MKASEIRALSREEMQQKISDLKQELFNLRFQHETGQLENTRVLSITKKTIARIHTIMTEEAGKPQQNENN